MTSAHRWWWDHLGVSGFLVVMGYVVPWRAVSAPGNRDRARRPARPRSRFPAPFEVGPGSMS